MQLHFTPPAAGRSLSIDAFRGLTFLAMIFVNELGPVGGIPAWLKHMPADADAMSFPDVVFPCFLFIVGMSIPFAIAGRLRRGDDAWRLNRHIAARAFALIVMGFFMVNAEEGFDAAAMAIPIALWSLLFYAAVLLVWGTLPFASATLRRALRLAGIGLILLLALLYRGAPQGMGWMAPQWWGILGLIGWSYLIASLLYQFARGRIAVLIGLIAACVAYYALNRVDGLPPALQWLLAQPDHAAHGSIVLCGVVCTLIVFDARRTADSRRRLAEAAAFAAALLAAGWLLRPWFGISKIYATPSWCLISAGIAVLVFGALHLLVDLRHADGWVRRVEPAASHPLLTYLLPFVIEAVLALAGLAVPAPLRQGALGIAWAVGYAVLVVWLVSRLARTGLRLQL